MRCALVLEGSLDADAPLRNSVAIYLVKLLSPILLLGRSSPRKRSFFGETEARNSLVNPPRVQDGVHENGGFFDWHISL